MWSAIIFSRKEGSMSNILNQNSDTIVDIAKNCANAQIAPYADTIDRDNAFPIKLWKYLGSHGLLGITAPKIYGGLEHGYYTHARVIQCLSFASASVALSYTAHANLCLNQIVRYGNKSQQEAFLPQLIRGSHIGALAISEHHAGTDAKAMQTTAIQKDNHFILDGHKMWITNAPDADIIVVYAKTAPDKMSAFIVPTKAPGVVIGKALDKFGMRGSQTAEVQFHNVMIPRNHLLGALHAGYEIMLSGLDYERVLLAAGAVGITECALSHAQDYSRQRMQFGKQIGRFQLVQGKMADMYTAFKSSEAYMLQAARACDANTITRRDAASTILYAAEQATKAALDAIQIFGANGYMNDYPVARLLRDAKLYEIGAGTSEIRRLIIGRDLFHGSTV